jgi:hypothetical protein
MPRQTGKAQLFASGLLVMCSWVAFSRDGQAQWYGDWGWGWGWGWSGEGSTPYSNAVRAEAEYVRAAGEASKSYAEAAAANEQARAAYMENQARLKQLRVEQKAAMAEQKARKEAEAQARVAKRPPPKPRTELYPRLSADQLDPLTGVINWPDCLKDAAYDEQRAVIEQALHEQAEYGPSDRTSKIIYDAAHRMLAIRAPSTRGMSSRDYSAYRRFLNSLAMEGEHAEEAGR